MDYSPLVANLHVEEGVRSSVYDDATGQPIVSGTTVQGNPTVGVGINLCDPNGLYPEEIAWLLNNRLTRIEAQCKTLAYWGDLNAPRKLAVMDMVFNMGFPTFQTFGPFNALMTAGNCIGAADDLESTLWHRQVGDRAVRVEQILRTGQWVSA